MKISLNIKLGFAAGIINCIAWYIFSKKFGYYSLSVDEMRYFVSLFLLLFGIFISIYYRRKQLSGYINFKEALKSGILYSIPLALLLAIFNYVYYKYIAVDAVDYFVNEAKNTMTKSGLKEVDINKTLEVVKTYFGAFRIFMSTIIMGLIFSVLASAILRKKKPAMPFSEN